MLVTMLLAVAIVVVAIVVVAAIKQAMTDISCGYDLSLSLRQQIIFNKKVSQYLYELCAHYLFILLQLASHDGLVLHLCNKNIKNLNATKYKAQIKSIL